jgi:hypothetical protein
MNPYSEVFTTNYGITYDNWVPIDLAPDELTTVYLWCNYYIYVKRSNYYLFLTILDNNNKVLFKNYVVTISDYLKIKKKLKHSKKCTEKDWVYLIGNQEEYLIDNNDNYLIP